MQFSLLTGADTRYIEAVKRNIPFGFNNEPVIDANYQLLFTYKGEIRYGPAYGSITIYKDGALIWQKEGATHSGEQFGYNVLSAAYAKAVIIEWHSFTDPSQQNVEVIDLNSGSCILTLPKRSYSIAGHFYSFNAIFYDAFHTADAHVKHLDTGEEFMLLERIRQVLPNANGWSVCARPDSIIAFAKNTSGIQAHLLNLQTLELMGQANLSLPLSKNASFYSYLDKLSGNIVVEFSDYKVNSANLAETTLKQFYLLTV